MSRYKNNPLLIILVIILLIVTIIAIKNPEIFKKNSRFSNLDIMLNPQNYLNQDVTLKSITVIENPLSGPQIIEVKEDGNWVTLPLSYPGGISSLCTVYDLEGQIKKSQSYYFEAKRVICLQN